MVIPVLKYSKQDNILVIDLDRQGEEQQLFSQGGPGSGHHGHRGRIGLVGGSTKDSSTRRGSFEGVFDDFMKKEDEKFAKELQDRIQEIDKEMAERNKHRKRVEQVAERLGFPPEKIISSEEKGYYFTVGNQQFQANADYNPKTDNIQIFDIDELDEAEMSGILAHEVQHSHWNRYEKALRNKEPWAVELGTEYVEWDKKWRTLKEKDGITDYSKSYWKKAIRSRYLSDEENAVNETLAEIARLEVTNEDAFRDVAPEWKDLYYKIRRGGNVAQNKLFIVRNNA